MVLFCRHIPLLCVSIALQVGAIQAQVFQNVAPELGITQTNWNGTYGAAVSTADWNNDGWPT